MTGAGKTFDLFSADGKSDQKEEDTKIHNQQDNSMSQADLVPRITVVGVGGAGCNAVNNMIRSNLQGVNFVVMNTDAQSLAQSLAIKKVQLGEKITQGLGAGAVPDVGKHAAEESVKEIENAIAASNMIFIAAGEGGGTGTGAAPIIASIAKEKNILTVGVVTKPFHFEGARRMKMADKGILEFKKYVNTLIVIPNQNLFRVASENTTFADAFSMADDVLHAGVRGITDLMIMPGLINLDFADVRSVMNEMGTAMMGTGEAEGDGRAIAAAEDAIANPLLDDVSMRGAKGVLISITGGMDMTLFEVDEAANRIREEVEIEDANIIFGSTFDERLSGKVRVSVVATGINRENEDKVVGKNDFSQKGRDFEGSEVDSDIVDLEVSLGQVENSLGQSENEKHLVKTNSYKKQQSSGLFKKIFWWQQDEKTSLPVEKLDIVDAIEIADDDEFDLDSPAYIRRKRK